MAKVLVSLEDALLRQIDRVARARGLSRSAYLAEIADRDVAQALGRGKTPDARRALARIETLVGRSPAGESTELIRAERDAR
jgi:metal-responsive CopG/Arc/MetJ family transcriptional regulator